ncbi:hypothetical protein C7212DRAFT_200176 [Tuber magnatum]|uniref:Uncharacterized protein n=1 Tax=Tuber magnatum TaxID=42249 RepID=A0A317SV71_9PEZI|nr:hypothetical protein C7212DRAFT_200176 [Tuber magnatum]
MFPTAGHQMDLNHLWQQVQELSAILAQNRESTAGLVRRADEIRSRTNSGEALPHLRESNGEANGTHDVGLEAENRALRQENHHLQTENEDLSLLVQDYETVLDKVLEGLRVYAHEHTVSTINIHQTYTNQLASERQANAILRQNETESQARLTGISKMLREAYEQDTALEPEILIEGLKVENDALREALGLPKEEEEEEISPV